MRPRLRGVNSVLKFVKFVLVSIPFLFLERLDGMSWAIRKSLASVLRC